jgi:hypothetical protein
MESEKLLNEELLNMQKEKGKCPAIFFNSNLMIPK